MKICFRKFFKDTELRLYSNINELKNDHPVSSHLPAPMGQILTECNIPDDNYILCPLYEEGDYQLGVTGKPLFGDRPETGLTRELGEELGIIYVNPRSLKCQKTFRVGQRINYAWTCDISETKRISDNDGNLSYYPPVIPDKAYTRFGEIKEDFKVRVGCIVHGDFDKISEYMSNVSTVWSSGDKIIGVIAISAKDAKDMAIKMLNENTHGTRVARRK